MARSDPNLGVRTGAKRSYFVDHNWEMTHSAPASCIYAGGEFDATGSLIHRDGTLNGIATANASRVHVAGGYNLSDRRKSPYSSAGPARGPVHLATDLTTPYSVTSLTRSEAYVREGTEAGPCFDWSAPVPRHHNSRDTSRIPQFRPRPRYRPLPRRLLNAAAAISNPLNSRHAHRVASDSIGHCLLLSPRTPVSNRCL